MLGPWASWPLLGPSALELKPAALLALTLLCGLMPLRLLRPRKGGWGPPGPSGLLLLHRFVGGAFLAASLLDLLPGALGALQGALDQLRVKLLFPLPEFILAVGFLLVLILEQVLLACAEGEGEEGEAPPSGPSPPSGLRLGALLLSLCLSRGPQPTPAALLLSFCLGLRLAQGGLRGRAVAAGVALFSLAGLLSPDGAGSSPTAPSPLPRLSRAVLQGLAAGAFLYLACADALAHGTRSGTRSGTRRQRQRQRILGATALLCGFALLTGLLFLRV